jgi:hypothetical protein
MNTYLVRVASGTNFGSPQRYRRVITLAQAGNPRRAYFSTNFVGEAGTPVAGQPLQLVPGQNYIVRVVGENQPQTTTFFVPYCAAPPGACDSDGLDNDGDGTTDEPGEPCNTFPGQCQLIARPPAVITPPSPKPITLEWSCIDVQPGSCRIDDEYGNNIIAGQNGSPPGSVGTSLSVSTKYTITCTGMDGNPASTTVRVPVFEFFGGFREVLPR